MLTTAKELGVKKTMMLFVSVPIDFLRNHSIPMASVPIKDGSAYNQTRAAVIPVVYIFFCLLLSGQFKCAPDESLFSKPAVKYTLISFIPGGAAGLFIKYKTDPDNAPSALVTAYSLLSFTMSIQWIACCCNSILDIIQLFGFIAPIPMDALALTIIAWGNQLGDMTNDVAMTKLGFGEMAIAATVAGPLFNVLIGLGTSQVLSILKNDDPHNAYIRFSLWDHKTHLLRLDMLMILSLIYC